MMQDREGIFSVNLPEIRSALEEHLRYASSDSRHGRDAKDHFDELIRLLVAEREELKLALRDAQPKIEAYDALCRDFVRSAAYDEKKDQWRAHFSLFFTLAGEMVKHSRITLNYILNRTFHKEMAKYVLKQQEPKVPT